MKIRILAATILLSAITCHAQTISPVISEGHPDKHGVYKGEFTYTSASLKPLSVVIEPLSFTVTPDGKTKMRKLDSNVHVKLSESSFVVGVNQQHIVTYEVSADTLPVAITIYANAVVGRTREGEQVKIEIPSTVYICAKGVKECRSTVRTAWGIADTANKGKS